MLFALRSVEVDLAWFMSEEILTLQVCVCVVRGEAGEMHGQGLHQGLLKFIGCGARLGVVHV